MKLLFALVAAGYCTLILSSPTPASTGVDAKAENAKRYQLKRSFINKLQEADRAQLKDAPKCTTTTLTPAEEQRFKAATDKFVKQLYPKEFQHFTVRKHAEHSVGTLVPFSAKLFDFGDEYAWDRTSDAIVAREIKDAPIGYRKYLLQKQLATALPQSMEPYLSVCLSTDGKDVNLFKKLEQTRSSHYSFNFFPQCTGIPMAKYALQMAEMVKAAHDKGLALRSICRWDPLIVVRGDKVAPILDLEKLEDMARVDDPNASRVAVDLVGHWVAAPEWTVETAGQPHDLVKADTWDIGAHVLREMVGFRSTVLSAIFEMPLKPDVMSTRAAGPVNVELVKALAVGELQGLDTVLLGLLDVNPTTRMTLATAITKLKEIVAKVPDAEAKTAACYNALK